MKKRKLKKGVKRVLVAILVGVLVINFISNFNNVSKDELGNTCRGGIVKVCEKR